MSEVTKFAKLDARDLAQSPASSIARRSVAVLALIVAAPLGACSVTRPVPPPIMAHDYRDRHPVVLAEAPHTIDVFPQTSARTVDVGTEGRIREFVARYYENGTGQISILTPVGAPGGSNLNAVRHALAKAGVHGNVLVGTYPVTDPSLAAPIRLSFQGMKAKVAHRCGEWPQDLASGTSLEGWKNQTYWNFGCATQATLNAQISDPRDLATPRGETPSDIEMRMRGITRVRRGDDPTTSWKLKPSSISNVGGQ